MSLPALQLDDRDFQSLVSEARMRIAKTCPEWSEHNVSDPGITLIELFAWMTDILLYRVNRIPEKVEIALLDLLDVQLAAPEAARTDLRFLLTAPATSDISIPADTTEIATASEEPTGAIVFRVSRDVTIPALALEALALTRAGTVVDVPVDDGLARPSAAARAVFGNPPAAGDAIYLGTSAKLDGLVVRVDVAGATAYGAGIHPSRPPWIWEASPRPGEPWLPVEVLEDGTGGLNTGPAGIVLAISGPCAPAPIAGHQMYWLRCRLGDPPGYLASPEIDQVSLAAVGVTARAEHASMVEEETIGTSDGTPGQSFRVLSAPTLPLEEGEGLEVHDPVAGTWTMWERVDSFAESGPSSPHYVYDPAAGEVQFGPAIRVPRTAPVAGDVNPDEVPVLAAWRQCGKVPPQGALLRISRYHHGGGHDGNVSAGSLTVLRTPIPGVASVSNPGPAIGGIDLESMDRARQRAARELRTRERAITAGDYELLGRRATSQVARVRCETPHPGQAIPIRILPDPGEAARPLTLAELTPSGELLEEVAQFLGQRSPIGTSVHVTPAPLRGVTVVVEVEAEPAAVLQSVETAAADALYGYLNPIVGGEHADDDAQQGWEWGRRLTVGELHPLVRAVPGVRSIVGLRVYEADLSTGMPSPRPVDGRLEIGPSELIASGSHLVRAVRAGSR